MDDRVAGKKPKMLEWKGGMGGGRCTQSRGPQAIDCLSDYKTAL